MYVCAPAWLNLINAVVSGEVLERTQIPGNGLKGDYTYCYTVTARMTPVLKRAALRAILMFH